MNNVNLESEKNCEDGIINIIKMPKNYLIQIHLSYDKLWENSKIKNDIIELVGDKIEDKKDTILIKAKEIKEEIEKKVKEGKEIIDDDIAGGEALKRHNLENVNPEEFIQKLKNLIYKIRAL